MISATALPVSIALAGHTNCFVCRNVIATSRIQHVPIAATICGTLTQNPRPTWPRTCTVSTTTATCRRGSRMFGRTSGYVACPMVTVRAVMVGHHRVMSRDQERVQRARQEPIVGGLPDVPGIGVAMRLTPGLGVHLRGLADEVLVHDFPGATLRRDQRELLATAVSAANDCFFCMDSHGAFVAALLEKDGAH